MWRSTSPKRPQIVPVLAATADGSGAKIRFDLPLARTQMADVLSLTIEAVSRQMTRLKRAGGIDPPAGRKVTIRDHGGLKELSEAA